MMDIAPVRKQLVVLTSEWRFDPELITEVEVRFVALGAHTTRIELEHRHIERMGPKAGDARLAVDSPGGWGAILESFGKLADRGVHRT